MPIRLECACGRRLNLDDKLFGKRIKCPECGNAIRVNGKPPAPPPEDEADLVVEEHDEQPKAAASKSKAKTKPKPEEKIGGECLEGKSKFIIKEQGKASKKTYEICDGDDGDVLATGKPKSGFLDLFTGGVAITFRQSSDNAPVFTVKRSGMLMKKVQVLIGGASGKVLGTYKAKMLSLTGGFHIYDKAGKHVAEIKGKMFSSDYKILTPDGDEIGSVSQSWGGLAKALFTGKGTFGVQIAPAFADDANAKIRILGATIAINALFKKAKAGGKISKGGDDDGGGGEGGGDE
ncbi:MAG TPA: phospholipid scramblase-related protein [Gemmataceae bacterium]|nr:phospholipid scramblase-related protein [Gemmataceae bacterium]